LGTLKRFSFYIQRVEENQERTEKMCVTSKKKKSDGPGRGWMVHVQFFHVWDVSQLSSVLSWNSPFFLRVFLFVLSEVSNLRFGKSNLRFETSNEPFQM